MAAWPTGLCFAPGLEEALHPAAVRPQHPTIVGLRVAGWRQPPDRLGRRIDPYPADCHVFGRRRKRSEEHTSELQSLMRNSYAVFCLKKQLTRNVHHLTSIIT